VRVQSPRFGSIEVEKTQIIEFEMGLPGFPDCTRFVILDHDRETPLKWLQALDRPEVAFLIVEPDQVVPGYQLKMPAGVLPALGWTDGDDAKDLGVFLILNVEDGELTANLRAPVIVHVRERRALQVIVDDPDVPLRRRIAPDA
jgi:flagellar assembly factor FliW